MARTQIAISSVPAIGINNFTPAAADSVNGNQWSYGGGRRTLVVNNTDAAAKTVTVRSNMIVDSLAVPDRVFTVNASAMLLLRESIEHLQSDGNCYVDFSAATNVKVWVQETA